MLVSEMISTLALRCVATVFYNLNKRCPNCESVAQRSRMRVERRVSRKGGEVESGRMARCGELCDV